MNGEKKIKCAAAAVGEALALCTVVWLIAAGKYDRLPMAVGTLLLVLLPGTVEALFRCRFSMPVYISALLYAIGPMLGQCWNFYYTISWWDKLLHICGGVMFAILGAYFFRRLTDRKAGYRAEILFALCFSVALAAVWEFVEFGADRLLGMDMQDDTVITSLTSYLLESLGALVTCLLLLLDRDRHPLIQDCPEKMLRG